MALNENLQNVFKNQFETAVSLAGKLAGNANQIAAEVQHLSVASLQSHANLLHQLAGAKTVDDVIQIQSDHAKATYEETLARSKKIGELLTDFSSVAVKSVAANAEHTKEAVKAFSPAKKLQAAE
jgi:hypothetical protein